MRGKDNESAKRKESEGGKSINELEFAGEKLFVYFCAQNGPVVQRIE